MLVFAVCGVTACASGGSTAAGHVGTYVLESIDGQPISVAQNTHRIISAAYTLEADGDAVFTARQIASNSTDTTEYRSESTYSLRDGALVFTPSDPDDTIHGTGTLSGSTLTSTDDGHVMVYRLTSSPRQ